MVKVDMEYKLKDTIVRSRLNRSMIKRFKYEKHSDLWREITETVNRKVGQIYEVKKIQTWFKNWKFNYKQGNMSGGASVEMKKVMRELKDFYPPEEYNQILDDPRTIKLNNKIDNKENIQKAEKKEKEKENSWVYQFISGEGTYVTRDEFNRACEALFDIIKSSKV